MANEQGWKDFNQITRMIGEAKKQIIQFNNVVERLKVDKAAILDDATRRAEMKKIVDIHPDYTVTNLQADFQKMIDLQTYLVDNNYV
jgi:hypothetical protein